MWFQLGWSTFTTDNRFSSSHLFYVEIRKKTHSAFLQPQFHANNVSYFWVLISDVWENEMFLRSEWRRDWSDSIIWNSISPSQKEGCTEQDLCKSVAAIRCHKIPYSVLNRSVGKGNRSGSEIIRTETWDDWSQKCIIEALNCSQQIVQPSA